jgi:hypothetical protein
MAKRIAYKVSYKRVGSWLWKTRFIYEDGIIEGTDIRFFVDTKERRWEVPLSQIELRFSPERVEAIEELNRKNRESAQTGMIPPVR